MSKLAVRHTPEEKWTEEEVPEMMDQVGWLSRRSQMASKPGSDLGPSEQRFEPFLVGPGLNVSPEW